MTRICALDFCLHLSLSLSLIHSVTQQIKATEAVCFCYIGACCSAESYMLVYSVVFRYRMRTSTLQAVVLKVFRTDSCQSLHVLRPALAGKVHIDQRSL